MSLLKLLWTKADEIQRRFGVRITLSVLCAAVVLGLFGWLYVIGAGIQRDRNLIVQTLAEANLTRGDQAAVDFATTGTVDINGRTFGNESLIRQARDLYDDSGALMSPFGAARLLLADRVPPFVPPFLLEQSDTVLLLAFAALTAALLSVWTGLFPHLVLTALATALLIVPSIVQGELAWVIAIVTAVALCYSFALLVSAAAMALSGANPTVAIAANVLREALRLRIATFFVGVLLVALPLIPLWIDISDACFWSLDSSAEVLRVTRSR